jgi:3-oxoacyl-[acyl-carrier-protein] synthase-3
MNAINHHLPAISIIGVGHHLPLEYEDNESLCRNLEVTPQWIVEKTGIESRYISAPGDTAWSYAVSAAHQALEMASITPDQLGLIVCCTFAGDYQFPPLSAKVAQQLGATYAQIYDLNANCSGFVTGLTNASDRLRVDPSVGYALVIGVEFCTRFIDRCDANTAIYLSDAAGAAVLGPVAHKQGIQASAFHTDPSNYEAVRLRGGGAGFAHTGRPFDSSVDLMEMNGLATWKQAITHLPPTIRHACAKAEVEVKQLDFIVLHQANLRLIEYLVRKLGLSMDNTYTNVAQIGNSGSASLAVALSEAVRGGHIKSGDLVALAGVGAGFNFAANIWRWTLDIKS